MINLLPEESKKQLRAARTNVLLIHFLTITGLSVAFLFLACAGTYLFLLNQKNIATEQSKAGQSAQTNNVSAAGSILSQQSTYSSVVIGIASSMPSGVVLDRLPLSDESFGMPLTLQFYANSEDNAAKLKTSLQNSPIFSSVSFQPTSPGNSSTPSGYPITVTANVTINKPKGLSS